MYRNLNLFIKQKRRLDYGRFTGKTHLQQRLGQSAHQRGLQWGEKPTTHQLQKQACNPLLLHPDKVEYTNT